MARASIRDIPSKSPFQQIFRGPFLKMQPNENFPQLILQSFLFIDPLILIMQSNMW